MAPLRGWARSGQSILRRHFRTIAFGATGLGVVIAISMSAPLESAPQNRTLTLVNTHTKERVSVTFKRNGRYLEDGLKQLNYAFRDWRRNEVTRMDPKIFDLLWEVYQEVGAREPIHVVSGYRSPVTNAALRRRSRGVAKFSQHTMGRAVDFYIPDVPSSKVRAAGFRRQVGGVGFYPNSRHAFIHLDTGRVRAWPRMTRKQLLALFPDGKTLHLPSDGPPLEGYQLAQKLEKQGKLERLGTTRGVIAGASSPTRIARDETTADDGDAAVANAGGNILTALFRGNRNNAPAATQTAPGATPDTPAVVASLPPSGNEPSAADLALSQPQSVANTPLPPRRPAEVETAPAAPVLIADVPTPAPRPADLDRSIAIAALAERAAEEGSLSMTSYASPGEDGVSELMTATTLASVPPVLREGLPLSRFQNLQRPEAGYELIDLEPDMPRPPDGAPMHLTAHWSVAYVNGTSHFTTADPANVSGYFAVPRMLVENRFGRPVSNAPMGRFEGRAIKSLPVVELDARGPAFASAGSDDYPTVR